jgi:hypothetical protein
MDPESSMRKTVSKLLRNSYGPLAVIPEQDAKVGNCAGLGV